MVKKVEILSLCVASALAISCAKYILNQSQETIGSASFSRSYKLEILDEPRDGYPAVVFRATREDSIRDAVRTTTTLANSFLGIRIRERTLVKQVDAARVKMRSCPVTVRVNDGEARVVQCDPVTGAKFDLLTCIDSVRTDQDIRVALAIQDTPQVLKVVIVPRQIVSRICRRKAELDSARRAAAQQRKVDEARIAEQVRLDSLREDVEQRRQAELQANQERLHSQDAVICLGMSQSEVEGLIGSPDRGDNCSQPPSWPNRITFYELENPCYLELSYGYSHVAGAYLLDGAFRTAIRKWGDGFYIGSLGGSDGSFPPNYTGWLKREQGLWYSEYYWMGERKWWGVGSPDSLLRR